MEEVAGGGGGKRELPAVLASTAAGAAVGGSCTEGGRGRSPISGAKREGQGKGGSAPFSGQMAARMRREKAAAAAAVTAADQSSKGRAKVHQGSTATQSLQHLKSKRSEDCDPSGVGAGSSAAACPHAAAGMAGGSSPSCSGGTEIPTPSNDGGQPGVAIEGRPCGGKGPPGGGAAAAAGGAMAGPGGWCRPAGDESAFGDDDRYGEEHAATRLLKPLPVSPHNNAADAPHWYQIHGLVVCDEQM